MNETAFQRKRLWEAIRHADMAYDIFGFVGFENGFNENAKILECCDMLNKIDTIICELYEKCE